MGSQRVILIFLVASLAFLLVRSATVDNLLQDEVMDEDLDQENALRIMDKIVNEQDLDDEEVAILQEIFGEEESESDQTAAVSEEEQLASDQSFSMNSQLDLNELLQQLLPSLRSKLLSVRIPDQSGKSGRVSYTLSNMQITAVSFGPASLVANSGNTLSLSATINTLNGRLNWRYKYKKWFIRISDSGSLTLKSGSIRLGLSVRFTGGDPPSIRSTGCSFNIGRLSVKFRGGASWIYNLFKGTIARRIKSALNGRVCGYLEPVINDQGNQALQRLAG